MKLSFIIPAWNRADTIGFCIDSILSQPEVCDFEVIVIDDCSTDSTVSLIEAIIGCPTSPSLTNSLLAKELPVSCLIFRTKGIEYEYRMRARIRILNQSKNMGAAIARNRGLEEAQGDFIWFVDSDDFIGKNALPIIVETLSNENFDILRFHKQNRDTVSSEYLLPSEKRETRILDVADLNNLRYAMNTGTVWNAVFRREAIGNIRFKSGLAFGEDTLFSWQVALVIQKAGFIDTPLYGYMFTPGSTTDTKSAKRFACYIDIIEELIRSIEKSPKSEKEKKILIKDCGQRLYLHVFYCFQYSEISSEMWKKWFTSYHNIMVNNKWRSWWQRSASTFLWLIHSRHLFIVVFETIKLKIRIINHFK